MYKQGIVAILVALFASIKAFYVPANFGLAGRSSLFSSDGDDVIQRRKKRRGNRKEPITAPTEIISTPPTQSKLPEMPTSNSDGTSTLEDLFGLGGDQLRELNEQELPVPREDVSTGKALKESDADKNKVFKLPDLSDFVGGNSRETKSDRQQESDSAEPRVDRSNQAEYLRVLQLNPFADADDTKFIEEYDIFPSIFGSGKLLGIPIPYLQQGHGMLLLISLIAALVYAPGNPLTEFPPEIRTFLKQGLVSIYAINTVLAVRAYFIARSKNLPGAFWAIKTFILGGLPFYEITEAKDPSKLNPDPSDRKSKNRSNKNNKY